MENLKILPKLTDSITYLYIEKCRVEQDNLSIKLVYAEKEVAIPCAELTLLYIGPGVSITHAAIIALSLNGCIVVWCGENLRKFYCYGYGETKSAKNILKQSMACMNSELHLEVVRKMYKLRFPKENLDDKTLAQMRGMEGVRVRTYYNYLSKKYNVKWNGRNLKGIDYSKMDIINKAITYNNSLLYALCTGIIVSLGYNTSLGFIHVGNINSFVYDIADLYKADIALPVAFEVVSYLQGINKVEYLENELRKHLRIKFKESELMKKVVEDLLYLFKDIEVSYGDNIDGSLWDYNRDIISNKNYGDSDGSIYIES